MPNTLDPALEAPLPEPESEAAYFASIWGLSNPQMKKLEDAFRVFSKSAVVTSTERLNDVRAAIRTLPLAEAQPEFYVTDLVSRLPKFEKKETYNALTYLTRKGELERLGYGRYLIKNLLPPAASPQAEIDRLREALTEIDAMAAAACAKARDASEWGISSAIDPIANVASGSLSQPITFAAWCDKLNAHHEHLRQTEKDFEGYSPGKLTDDTGVECWTSYYASGSTPEGALAEDRTYWGD